jgi:HSP20 family protein
MKHNQFNSMVPFVQIVDDLLTKTFHDVTGGQLLNRDMPALNVLDLENEFRLELAAPGLEKSDFKIALENNYLVISADKKQEHSESKEHYTRKEFSFQTFKRMYELPEHVNIDAITAKYENGILHVSVQKKTPAPKNVKTIEIK